MAKWGNCDYKQLEKLTQKFEKMSKFDVDTFCQDVARELAARLLAKVIKRTPVGEGTFEVLEKDGVKKRYKVKSGGTLRRGWTANTQAEAESGKVPNARDYANSLKILRMGNKYAIIVKNPVEYASYVEFGHRQEPGRFVPAIRKEIKTCVGTRKIYAYYFRERIRSTITKINRKEVNEIYGGVF